MSSAHEGPIQGAPNSEFITNTIQQYEPKTLAMIASRATLGLALAFGAGTAMGTAGAVAEPRPQAAYAGGDTYPDSSMICVAPNDPQKGQITGSGYWCDDYQWGYLTYNAQGQETGNVQNSPRGYGYRNCTDWVAWRIKELTGVTLPKTLGNGGSWDDNAPSTYSVDTSPEVGDIAVWDSPGIGHVAVVEAVNSDGTVDISEYNQGLNGAYGTRDNKTAHHYIDVNGPNEPPAPPADTDSDGIIDTQDHCPTMPGIPALYGCRPNDIDGDGIADLAVVNVADTGTGGVEVHPLAGSGGFVNWLGHHDTVAGYLNPSQQTLMGDINNDGKPDLLVVNTTNTSTGKIEVHPLSGASHYEGDWMGHYPTPANYLTANQRLVMADVNNDGRDDLLIIDTANTGSGKVEIHPLDAATNFSTWVDHYVTPANYLAPTDQLLAGDSDGDGKDEVFIVNTVNTGSGKLEAHRLDPDTHYGTWEGHDTITPMAAGSLRPDQRLVVGDVNADGMDDIAVVNTNGSLNGSGKVEVHPLSGQTHYSSWLGHYSVTPLTTLDPNTQRVVMGGQA